MENQKIINLLDKIDILNILLLKNGTQLMTKITNYGVNKDTGANNPDTIKYDTRVLKPNLCECRSLYFG